MITLVNGGQVIHVGLLLLFLEVVPLFGGIVNTISNIKKKLKKK